MDISVIIPFCNEMPQVAFTVQAIIEELEGLCDYEVILVDNMSGEKAEVTVQEAPLVMGKNYLLEGHGMPQMYNQPRTYPVAQRKYFHNSETGRTMGTYFFRTGKVKYFIYDEKLGHWNAKNHGIKNSTGEYLFFLDSHCIMKRDSMKHLWEFCKSQEEPFGGAHAYINYMLDSRCLEYIMGRTNAETGEIDPKFFGYQFVSHQKDVEEVRGKRVLKMRTQPYKVAVMSTCGMMCSRKVIEELGAWHPELGIYGGGESYINWKQSTCGYPHWIVPQAWCWHYAEKRGYAWNHTDYMRNGMIAAYVVGGEKWLQNQVEVYAAKGRRSVVEEVAQNIRDTCTEDRQFVKSKQTMTFDEYIEYWEQRPGVWK